MLNPQSLKETGLRATVPRLKILELFERSAVQHLCAEEVHRILASEGIKLGLATVYRVLAQFEQAGLLERHNFEDGKAVYEINHGKHHSHLICTDCGRVEEFCDPKIEARLNRIAREGSFVIQEHSLLLFATCTKPYCPHRKEKK